MVSYMKGYRGRGGVGCGWPRWGAICGAASDDEQALPGGMEDPEHWEATVNLTSIALVRQIAYLVASDP